MNTREVEVVGIGAWAVGFEGWSTVERALIDPSFEPASSTHRQRPASSLLPPAERRRAPDGIAVALEVAHEALQEAIAHGVDPTTLASVFASAHGDLSIVDAMCRTLATDPTGVSPTRFHLSVHNAAAAYWSIATRDMAATTALAGGDDSFALGLLEATTLCLSERRAVLLVAFDTPAVGLLAQSVRNTALFGFALVMRPAVDSAIDTRIDTRRVAIGIDTRRSPPSPLPSNPAMHALAMSSPAARALALAETLALRADAILRYPLGSGASLSIDVRCGAMAHARVG